ncbi:hypothetical protein JTE90_015096 [Oedothorax gibbosus]|uniref:Uncharacterized protein n=1 Tax=Oedothorax gibbosus TaxID=931172 RepID=A0AAV6VPZ9_9ARAC|nr:hypothetical protein JTE90_015096 [Oedothorax gibbosus]
MMKWKVARNPRCVSADRSLECLRNKDSLVGISDSNNNQCKEETPNDNETNSKQQETGFTRKPSLKTTECINLKSFLGLSRQRSDTNLTNLGLTNNESRRSRSEVRGISCDRLTIGYHTPSLEPSQGAPVPPPGVAKASGWLRGRKKEREARSNAEIGGKTVVTGTRRTNSINARTIADQSCGVLLKNVTRLPSEGRGSIPQSGGNSTENVVEEDIYMEMGQPKMNEVKSKVPPKPGRKKCQAPKPQPPNVSLKESNCDVNLNPNGHDGNVGTNYFIEKKMSPMVKPARKLHSMNGNGKHEEKNLDNRTAPTVKLNNLKNSETFLTVKNKIHSDSNTYITVAEIHKHTVSECETDSTNKLAEILENQINENKKALCDFNQKTDISKCSKINQPISNNNISEEIPAYHIDTPDYSTLESVVDNNKLPTEIPVNILKNKTSSLNDLIDCISLNYSSTEPGKRLVQGTLSSILRDSSNDLEFTPKKVVRFEKLDLIETYRKNKADGLKDSDEESIASNSEKKNCKDKILDVNSNEVVSSETEKITISQSNDVSDKTSSSSSDCVSESSAVSSTESECVQKALAINLLIKNTASEIHAVNGEPQNEETQQSVVKKSFVLTVAKQEKGFKSLCANKKLDLANTEPPKVDKTIADHKISVTFLCAEAPPVDIVKNEPHISVVRLRSISVPPGNLLNPDTAHVQPVARGRSRERRCKSHHHKKNHKSKKKDSSHHMPQAVIDELSQVLEKRKPSLDKNKKAPRMSQKLQEEILSQ